MLLALAMKPRRGPVCVNLPRNILAATNTYKINTNKPSFESESSLKGNNEKIKKAAKIINQASQFVIIAGGGIKYTAKYKEVIKLAELLNVPIVTAAGHGDAIPFNHKLKCRTDGTSWKPCCIKTC
jgi:thiamine pyrophosphate-dependent acetolactate synthase large subunit-like protein